MQDTDNRQPLVSFIITYYNEPAFILKECLDSILSVDLAEDEREIIIIDDGSDVCVISELEKYERHILYLRQPNAGVSAARNRGITMATGTYIQFVDADDCIISGSYNHCVDIARKHVPDMVLFNLTQDNNVDTPYLFEGPLSGSEYMRKHNVRASVCGYLFQKKTLIDLRFTAGIAFGEDEQFTPQLLLRAETVYYTDICAYYYRENMQSVTHNKTRRALVKRLSDTEHVIAYLSQLSANLPAGDRSALQRRVCQLTMDYIYNIIIFTRSEHQLEKRIERLQKKGLYPLPDRSYTQKYQLFRRLIHTKIGRKILLRTLPIVKREQ